MPKNAKKTAPAPSAFDGFLTAALIALAQDRLDSVSDHLRQWLRADSGEGKDDVFSSPQSPQPQASRDEAENLAHAASAEFLDFNRAVAFLVENGANPHDDSFHRRTPLLIAAEQGHAQAAQALLPVSNPATTILGMTALHLAAKNGRAPIVTLLLPAISPRATDVARQTPLHLAAQHGHLDCVKRLAPVSDLSACDRSEMTPLMRAALNGHADVVRELLAFGVENAKINAFEKSGLNALGLACAGEHLECVKLLLPLSKRAPRSPDRDALAVAINTACWECVDCFWGPETEGVLTALAQAMEPDEIHRMSITRAAMERDALFAAIGQESPSPPLADSGNPDGALNGSPTELSRTQKTPKNEATARRI